MPITETQAATPHLNGSEQAVVQEPVWKLRGYKMRPDEFNTTMVHYTRAEKREAFAGFNRVEDEFEILLLQRFVPKRQKRSLVQ